MTRAEHLAWCKQRALGYLDRGDLVNALTSFRSDMGKHPDTADHSAMLLLEAEGTRCAITVDARGMRQLIEGFA